MPGALPKDCPCLDAEKESGQELQHHIARNAVPRQLGHRISCGRSSCSIGNQQEAAYYCSKDTDERSCQHIFRFRCISILISYN